MRKLFVASAALSILAAGCSGGGGPQATLPAQPPAGSLASAPSKPPGTSPLPPTGPQGTGTVIASATVNGQVPALFARTAARARRSLASLRAQGLTVANVTVNGAIYPSYVSPVVIYNTQTVTPVNGTVSASVAFTNVPAGNNEWLTLSLTANAPDGSSVDLGQFAGLVNVTSGASTQLTLSDASTQRLQVLSALLGTYVSSYDLANNPNLDATMGAYLGTFGQAPSPATNLFTTTQLALFVNKVAPDYIRPVTVNIPSGTPATLSVVPDWTNAAEKNLVSNKYVLSAFTGYDYVLLNRQGNVPVPLGALDTSYANTPAVAPAAGPPQTVISTVAATELGPVGATVSLPNVYGGNVMIGASSNAMPYTGGWVNVAGRASGSTTNVTVPMASTQISIPVNDAVGFAMLSPPSPLPTPTPNSLGLVPTPNPSATPIVPYYPFYSVSLVPAQSNALVPAFAFRACVRCVSTYADNSWSRVSVPNNFSSTNNQLVVDTWNPWNVDIARARLCGGQTCVSVSPAPSTPVSIARPFIEIGSNVGFFGWTPAGGGTTSVTQAAAPSNLMFYSNKQYGAYTIAYNALAPAIATSIFAPAVSPISLVPAQSIYFLTSKVPDGTVVTLTATDGGGNLYSGSTTTSSNGSVSNGGRQYYCGGSWYSCGALTMASIGAPIVATQLTLSFTFPAGTNPNGSFSLYDIGQYVFTARY